MDGDVFNLVNTNFEKCKCVVDNALEFDELYSRLFDSIMCANKIDFVTYKNDKLNFFKIFIDDIKKPLFDIIARIDLISVDDIYIIRNEIENLITFINDFQDIFNIENNLNDIKLEKFDVGIVIDNICKKVPLYTKINFQKYDNDEYILKGNLDYFIKMMYLLLYSDKFKKYADIKIEKNNYIYNTINIIITSDDFYLKYINDIFTLLKTNSNYFKKDDIKIILCYKLINLLNGNINFEKINNTFKLDISVKFEKSNNEKIFIKSQSCREIFHSLNIYLSDENETVEKFVYNYLSVLGHNVCNGKIDKYKFDYDIFLVGEKDLTNIVEFVRNQEKLLGLKRIPIIGIFKKNNENQLDIYDIDGIMFKPIDFAVLEKNIINLVNNKC